MYQNRSQNSKKSFEEIINLDEDDSDEIYDIKYYEKNNKNSKKEKTNKKLVKNITNENLINNEELCYKNNDKGILSKKRKRQNYHKKLNIGLEFKLYYKLVEKYGIEKVLSSLCDNDNIFSMNEVDKIIDQIKEKCGKDKFINNIIKTYYSLLNDYINDNPDIKNTILDNYNNFNQQRILKEENTDINNNQAFLNFQFNINDIVEIPINKENNNNKKLGLESHYNKNEDGNIYKYKIMYLLGKLAIFKCSDIDCNGDGIFDLETKKFTMQQKHNKKYSEHNFFNNEEINNDIVFKEMNINGYKDAQVIFKDKSKIVSFYS